MNPIIGRLATLALVISVALCPGAGAQDKTPRIEVGPILSGTANQYGLTFRPGGGGRVTVNVNRFIGTEIESIRYHTGSFPFGSNSPEEVEVHTSIAVKGTYRLEQKQWLHGAGVNFFGVVGPGFVNRTIQVVNPNPPPASFRATLNRRHTTPVFDFGGGVEIVPVRPLSIRLDVTGVRFSETPPYASYPMNESRVFLKLATMFRFR